MVDFITTIDQNMPFLVKVCGSSGNVGIYHASDNKTLRKTLIMIQHADISVA